MNSERDDQNLKPTLNNRGSRGKGWRIDPITVYDVIAVLALVALLLCILLSHGEKISHYLFTDKLDTGMDFLNSLTYLKGSTPYENFHVLYPPLANLYFLFLIKFVPNYQLQTWRDSSTSAPSVRGTANDLRIHQATFLIYILTFILVAAVLVIEIEHVLRDVDRRKTVITKLCILFSPGFLWVFDRGNILVFSVLLVLYFVMFKDAKNVFLRETALIALALAAGLKLYPAFYGVLLLRDKKYLAAVRTILYGLLTVFVPLMFFTEGLMALPIWLRVVFRFGQTSSTPWSVSSFSGILHEMLYYIRKLTDVDMDTAWFGYAGYAVAAMLLISSLFAKKEWESLLMITFAIVMYSYQGSYIYSFFCIPFLFFLREEKTLTLKNTVPFLAMLFCMVDFPLFYYANELYLKTTIFHILSVAVIIWTLCEMISLIKSSMGTRRLSAGKE